MDYCNQIQRIQHWRRVLEEQTDFFTYKAEKMTAPTILIAPYTPEQETIEEFLQRFVLQMSDQFGKNLQKKLNCLIKSLPITIITAIQRRIAPKQLTSVDYDEVEALLLQQFSVRETYVASAVKFLHYRQKPGENIEDYGRSLNALASKCNYKQCCYDNLLKQVFIANMNSQHIMASLLQKADSLSFNETLSRAKMLQQIRDDTEVIQNYDRTASVQVLQNSSQISLPDNYVCYRCGSIAKHNVNECYAINMTCNHCKKVGHLKNMCKQLNKKRSGTASTRRPNDRKAAVNHTECVSARQLTSAPSSGATYSTTAAVAQPDMLPSNSYPHIDHQHQYTFDSTSSANMISENINYVSSEKPLDQLSRNRTHRVNNQHTNSAATVAGWSDGNTPEELTLPITGSQPSTNTATGSSLYTANSGNVISNNSFLL